MMKKLQMIQDFLHEKNYDAWVIYDYECHNEAFQEIVGKIFLTRKVFVVIPKKNHPYMICHKIDVTPLKQNHIDDDFMLHVYQTWDELVNLLHHDLSQYQDVMMEMSEDGALPRSSYCDYGTVRLIEKCGVNVHSSADLLMSFIAPFKGESYDLHLLAMEKVQHIKDEAFSLIEKEIKENHRISEYDVQQFILRRMQEEDLVTDEPPVVAINEHAGNPHYTPNEKEYSYIKPHDLVLIDLWAKCNKENAVFADITWMGYVGRVVPTRYNELFHILEKAIDLGLDFINQNFPNRAVSGYEVDEVIRNYIKEKGYGNAFIHRTGHSISIDDTPHGKGVNIDSYETHDTRHLIDNICFSLEPGIYLEDCGFREEIDVYIQNKQAIVSGRRQREMITMDID